VTAAVEKDLLRARMRAWRRQLDPAWSDLASAAVISRLENLPIFQRARVIQTYVALPHEVNTHDLIRRLLQAGKKVAVPKVESENTLQQFFITNFFELAPGAYGIPEPPSDSGRLALWNQFDLVLVPGLAFDRSGHRLGAGKGYYDRLLASIAVPKIALAFAFQIVDKIPIAAHDQQVDMIVTEEEVIDCSRQS
jgi:5-formyltetrahydrofolate cyclo-ligase